MKFMAVSNQLIDFKFCNDFPAKASKIYLWVSMEIKIKNIVKDCILCEI